MTSDTSSKPRRGRPPAQEAGLIEERVLDAATALFLEQGFGRTTLDRVAQTAGTGKSSVYGRYSDKETLFAAVVERSIETMFRELAPAPSGGTVTERLRHVGLELSRSLLVPRCVAFMRITAAEAEAFPALARMAYDVSFEGSVQCALAALEPLELPEDKARSIACSFVELTVQPVSFQAAFGGSFEDLKLRAEADVYDAILLLEAKGLLN